MRLETLHSCVQCERDDIPFSEMSKDSSREYGVALRCNACRRSALPAKVMCPVCEVYLHEDALYQIPVSIRECFQEGTLLCMKCIDDQMNSDGEERARLRRYGLEGKSTAEIESQARVLAVKELIGNHQSEYTRLFNKQKALFGLETDLSWIAAG